MENIESDISALILAGGESSRFGGHDKGLIEYQGKMLIEHVIERVKPQCSELFISCNRHCDEYAKFGATLVRDDHSICNNELDDMSGQRFQGPLLGIATAMHYVNHPLMLVCSCDCPRLPRHLASALYHALQRKAANVSFAYDGERNHYLASLWSVKDCQDSLYQYLQQGGRTVKDFYKTVSVSVADCSSHQECFININQPSDLGRYQ